MNKYTELSDDEINVKVFINLYGRESLKDKDMRGVFSRVDYCNNPADAMPIIIENKIQMNFVNNVICWSATHRYTNKDELEVCGHRYYRIAMELLLMMKDAAKLNF